MNKKSIVLILLISQFGFAETIDECETLITHFKETKNVKKYTSSVVEIAQCFMEKDNYTEGFSWYLKSAKKGDIQSQNIVANMYYFGDGVEKDYPEAFTWFEKLAKKGDVSAQSKIGEIYYFGQGVKRSYENAFKWYTKAAQKPCGTAYSNQNPSDHSPDSGL